MSVYYLKPSDLLADGSNYKWVVCKCQVQSILNSSESKIISYPTFSDYYTSIPLLNCKIIDGFFQVNPNKLKILSETTVTGVRSFVNSCVVEIEFMGWIKK